MKTLTFHCARSFWVGSVAAFLAIGILPSGLHAQSQDSAAPSVAEAARKAKEQKKNSAKSSHVITDDTINLRPASADSGTTPPPGTVITSAPAASSEKAAAPAAAAPAVSATETTKTADTAADTAAVAGAPSQTAPAADDKKEKSAEAKAAKEMLAQLQAELDVLKRELSLDSESYYSNPDYTRDTAGKAKLEELQKIIGDKQVSLEEVKKQVEKLLQEAGISPGTDKSPQPPKN